MVALFQLVYELNEGRWTQHGTPLFFILVEGGNV